MHEQALQVAFAGLTLTIVLSVAAWLASLARRDVSLVDRIWSLLIAGAALAYLVLFPSPDARGLCMALLVSIWALRLSLFITLRNWGHGEDRRYQAIRARNQPGFAFKSLYLVFGLQALLAWTVAMPFLAGMPPGHPLGILDAVGFALAAAGIAFEAIADTQLARFKAAPANTGQVMDRGLWRWTRHPNYFGEACIWWGFWLIALAAAGWAAAWTLVSPVLMTLLLLKVSGVSLLEQDIGERRPAYRDYIKRTNAFVPGPRHPPAQES